MSKRCCICQDKAWPLQRVKLLDGYICQECIKASGMSKFSNAPKYACDKAVELFRERSRIVGAFEPTKKIKNFLLVDEANEYFRIGNDIFKYSNLLAYALIENNDVITSGGIGGAVAGGFLFGGVGAVVGGITSKKTSRNYCQNLSIKITLRDSHMDTVYIDFVDGGRYITNIWGGSFAIFGSKRGIEHSGTLYKRAEQDAQACISIFEIIADKYKMQQAEDASKNASSSADEIWKYKNLLDTGAITAEEYEKKKKQLLDS